MGGIFGGGGRVHTSAPVISSLRLHTSCYGRPVPWHFGRARVAPNVIQYEDFTAIAHTTTQSSGGKGGGPTISQTTYTYTAAIVMALCSGPIASVVRAWKAKDVTTPEALKLDVFLGTNDQETHPYFAASHPSRSLAYRGISYVASGAYDLGDHASLENHSFEIQAPGAISSTIPDADVADVLSAILTDPEQGLGLPAAKVGDLSAVSDFCRANRIWVSPGYTEQRPAHELLRNLLQIGFSDCVYSGGLLKVVPYSDVPAESFTGSFEPSIVLGAALTADDFIAAPGDDPVRIRRKPQNESYNHVQVRYLNRAEDYNEAVAEAKDEADIEQHGLRSMAVVELKEICDADTASKVAWFLLRRSLYVRNEYEFVLPWSKVLLEPMDVVPLFYAPQKLDGVPVMITRIEEDDSDDGLKVTAEDFPLGASGIGLVAPPTSDGYAPNFAVAPGNALTPVMIEPPLQLTGNVPQLWLASAGGPNWGGAEVWVSTDNVSYRRVGVLEGPSRYGTLTAPLGAGAPIDTLNQLAVDLSASRGALQGGTEENAEDLLTLCYVGGEYLAYADAALTGVNTYNLSYLVRGAYGTDIGAHAAGEPFVRVDDGMFRYAYPKDWLGKAIWVKLVSFNPYRGGLQDLSAVPAYSYVLQGAPLGAVQNLRLDTDWNGRDIGVAWDLLDGAESYDIEVQAGAPVTLRRALTGVQGNQFVYRFEDMLADGGPWRQVVVRVRGRSQTGAVGSEWSSLLVSNQQVGELQGVQIEAGYASIIFKCATPSDPDFAGILVWVGTTADFVPGQPSYDGPGAMAFVGKLGDGTELQQGQTYYVRYAGFDSFGQDGLTIGGSIAVPLPINLAGAVMDGVVQESSLASRLRSRIDRIDASQTAGDDAQAATQLLALLGADKAVATLRTLLLARLGSNEAAIQTVQTVLADATGALAEAIDTVQSTVGENTAAIEQVATSVNGLRAQLYLRADVNGRVAGMALGVDGEESEIAFVGSRFFIASQDDSGIGQAMFVVLTEPTVINGFEVDPGVYMNAAFINVAMIAQVIAGHAVIDAANIKDAVVGTAHIVDAAIETAKIADAAIETAKIKNGAIETAKIADAAIETAKIKDGAIETAKIADAAIETAKIKNGAIETAKIANAAIEAAKIKNAAVETLKIAGNAVTIPMFASGGSSASGVLTLDEPAFVMITFGARVTTLSSDPSLRTVTLVVGGVTRSSAYVGYPASGWVSGSTTSATEAFGMSLGAGAHSISVSCGGASTTYVSATAAKR